MQQKLSMKKIKGNAFHRALSRDFKVPNLEVPTLKRQMSDAISGLLREVIHYPLGRTLGLSDYGRKLNGELGRPTSTLELVTFVSD